MASEWTSAKGKKDGHIALTSHGDDGKVHFVAYRKRGVNLVEVGQYSIEAVDLLRIAEHALKGEEWNRKRGEGK